MKLGIFAKTFDGDTPSVVLRAARDAGFAAVQYNMACSGLGALPTQIPDAAVHDLLAARQRLRDRDRRHLGDLQHDPSRLDQA